VAATTPSSRSSPKSSADLIDVPALADRQLAIDKERTKRFPELFTRKMQRMSASPLAFLRGAAPLFFEMIASRKDLGEGPPGEGWIVGDLHLENFGAYRPDTFVEQGDKKRPAVFNLNDFDDTLIAPWRFDVLRLMTSLLLGGRELGCSGVLALELSDHLIDAWTRAVFDGEKPHDPPPPVVALIEQVRSRSRDALLDARTTGAGSKRHFVRGLRYADLSKDILAAVQGTFDEYLASVPEAERPQKAPSLEIHDAALRIAGTGSLGGLRIAVLVECKAGKDGNWIFDLKEQGVPSAASLIGSSDTDIDPAVRVVTGFRACVDHPPRVMGTTRIKVGDEMLPLSGRRLSPQEDKLNLKKIRGADLPALATYLGSLLGNAHLRGALKTPKTRWSKSDKELIRGHAITLAGIHEAIYLALCDRMRGILSASSASSTSSTSSTEKPPSK